MGGHESDAGRDDGSRASRGDGYKRAPRPHHSDMDNRSVTGNKRERGPPISMNRYADANGEFPPQRTSRSRSGSISASSMASDATLRPPSQRSASRSGSVTSKKTESVSSNRTARPSNPRARERDTDSQADRESYTSGRRSYTSKQDSETMVPEKGRGSLYEKDWKNGLPVYLQRNPRDSVPRSKASNGKISSRHEMARLSERTEGLNLNPPDDNGLGDLESVVIGEDHNGEDSSIQSYQKSTPSCHRSERSRPDAAGSYKCSHASDPSYIPPPPGSFASGFPPSGNRSHTSNNLALEEYRSTYAPSANRSHKSYNHDRYTPSEHQSYSSRNRPLSYGRGTYDDGHHNFGGRHNIGVVDLTQTQVNVTNIHAPDMSFMNKPSKREKRKMREHNLRSSRGGSRRDDSESDSDW